MQHDITTRVLGVQQIPSRDGKSIRHAVSLQGGTAADGTQYPPQDYNTFNAGLSNKSYSLTANQQGEPLADARVEIKQVPKRDGSGYFTNFVLHEIAPQGMLPPMPMPAPGGTPAMPMQAPTAPQPYQQQQAQPLPAPPMPQAAPLPAPPPPEQSVHPALAADEVRRSEERRRSAMHAAFSYTGLLVQGGFISDAATANQVAMQLTDDLVSFISTGSWNGSKSSEAQTPASPAELAQAANQELGEGAVTVGVPFETPEA